LILFEALLTLIILLFTLFLVEADSVGGPRNLPRRARAERLAVLEADPRDGAASRSRGASQLPPS